MLLSHLHADFVSGNEELRKRLGATVFIGAAAGALYPHYPVSEGDTLTLSSRYRMRALETPGHTPGALTGEALLATKVCRVLSCTGVSCVAGCGWVGARVEWCLCLCVSCGRFVFCEPGCVWVCVSALVDLWCVVGLCVRRLVDASCQVSLFAIAAAGCLTRLLFLGLMCSGCITWVLEDGLKPIKAFTGDTLFVGSIGRPDLVGSMGYSAEDMATMLFHSLHDKLMTLPDDVEVRVSGGVIPASSAFCCIVLLLELLCLSNRCRVTSRVPILTAPNVACSYLVVVYCATRRACCCDDGHLRSQDKPR